jgi:DNA-binding NarL/FixJ family response regulator
MNIFLVEDSAPVRERLAAMFDAIPGVRLVGHAEHAAAAIRDILSKRPDVVVLDMSLADGSTGFDVLRAVHPKAPHIDFYMLTNFTADPYRQLAARLGARELFDKSKEFGRVRELIATRAAAETPREPS